MLKTIIERIIFYCIAIALKGNEREQKDLLSLNKILELAIEIKIILLEICISDNQNLFHYQLQNKVYKLISEGVLISTLPAEIYKQLLRVSNIVRNDHKNKCLNEITCYLVQVDQLINIINNMRGKS